VQRYAALVGERLGMNDGELTTLEIAASLSQVGKIFVPEDILTKAGRLDEEQIQDMRRHVDHALRVIAPIEFDLPVPETIAQMYERLDGSGYPKGLSGDQIQPLARILGVVDVFCALTETRAYRHEQSTCKAMIYLAQHPHRYDVKVVAALAEVLAADGATAEEAVPEATGEERAAEVAA
jgi:HD-GYP domain-containing protein (c-di-GMP phosphodiesterase class II)